MEKGGITRLFLIINHQEIMMNFINPQKGFLTVVV